MRNSLMISLSSRRGRLLFMEACIATVFLWSALQQSTAVKLAGLTLAIAGAVCAWRYRESVAPADETDGREDHTALVQGRQMTEHFGHAMELLGHEKLEVRLGGIYALEQHIRDSEKDQGPIVEVLASYVRQRAVWQEGQPIPERLDSDIQAVLTVLGRRPWSYQKEDKPLDLHGTILTRAYLPFAHLERAFLYRANLEDAMLHKAHLEGAWLWGAHLTKANLDEAHLEGADLADAVGLTWEQLSTAHLDADTKLPAYLLETG
jgi:hypothetical protein